METAPAIKYEIYYNDHKFVSKKATRVVKEKRVYGLANQSGDRHGDLYSFNYTYKYKRQSYTKYEEKFDQTKIDLISISYIDYLTGSLDELDIEISDPTRKWNRTWSPTQNDYISGWVSVGDQRLDIQEFYIDEIDYSIYPHIIRLKALSGEVAKSSVIKKRRYDKYKDTSLRSIVSGIAQRNKLELQWSGEDVTILSLLSSGRSDLNLINDLAKKYGFFTKIFTRVKKTRSGTQKSKYLVFQDLSVGGLSVSWEGEAVTAKTGSGQRYITITDDDIIGGASFSKEANFVDRKEYKKYQPNEKKLEKFKANSATKQGHDAGSAVSRFSDGRLKNNARDVALEGLTKDTKALVVLSGRGDITAGTIVYFDSSTAWYGTYHIRKVIHSIDVDNGFTTSISEMRRLSKEDIPTPKPYTSTPKREENYYSLANERGDRGGSLYGFKTTKRRVSPIISD